MLGHHSTQNLSQWVWTQLCYINHSLVTSFQCGTSHFYTHTYVLNNLSPMCESIITSLHSTSKGSFINLTGHLQDHLCAMQACLCHAPLPLLKGLSSIPMSFTFILTQQTLDRAMLTIPACKRDYYHPPHRTPPSAEYLGSSPENHYMACQDAI